MVILSQALLMTTMKVQRLYTTDLNLEKIYNLKFALFVAMNFSLNTTSRNTVLKNVLTRVMEVRDLLSLNY